MGSTFAGLPPVFIKAQSDLPLMLRKGYYITALATRIWGASPVEGSYT